MISNDGSDRCPGAEPVHSDFADYRVSRVGIR